MNFDELKLEYGKYPSTMSAAERMKKYMAGEVVDHIPYSLHTVNESIVNLCGHTISELNDDFEVFAEVTERAKEQFGLEGINIRLSLRTMGVAMGSTARYPENGIDSISDHILKDYDDWNRLNAIDPFSNEVLKPLIDRGYQVVKRFPDAALTTGVVGPLSTAIAVRPIEKVLRDTKKDPKSLKKLLSLCVDNSLLWVEAFTKEFGGGSASISEPVATSDIISKSQFDEFVFPEMQRLVEGLKEITGAKPSLHICGHTKKIWEDLMRLDISSFSVDNCEDLAELKAVMGDYCPIIGNVPPVEVLRYGTIDDVIQSVITCLKTAANSPKGFILASGCSVPIGTSEENLMAYVYAARKYGRNAQKGVAFDSL